VSTNRNQTWKVALLSTCLLTPAIAVAQEDAPAEEEAPAEEAAAAEDAAPEAVETPADDAENKE